MTKLIHFPIALLALAAAQGSARADEDGPKTRAVPYGDLDLTRAGDVATLHNRISNAIIAVCGDPSPTNLHMLGLSARCRKETAKRMQIQVAQVVRGQHQVAAREDGGRRVEVSIADLDLGRSRDRRVLKQRLGIAVAQACGATGAYVERPVHACRAQLKSQLPVAVTRAA